MYLSTLKVFSSLAFLLLLPLLVSGQNAILVDGKFNDWNTVSNIHTDVSGDNGSSGIDFGSLKVSHTDEYLYLSIDVGTEINLQDLNDVTLYIDSDNNSSTGQSTNGLGADISYTFGSRSGSYFGSGTSSIRHGDLGLITAPTISSDQFEVALNRN
ncbi:MAG: hypothetical protein ACPGYY_10960, partial [Bacteroidia bacterium]